MAQDALDDLERGKLIQQLVDLKEDVKELRTDVLTVCKLLRGNGTVGLVVRVDRLEQRFIILGFIFVPTVSAIVSYIVAWMIPHP